MNYVSIKKIAFSVLPKRFLLRFEPFLRSLFLFRFRGSQYRCNICGTNLKKFVHLDAGDLLCPFCGSRSRTRALFHLLEDGKLLYGTVLHFSPLRSLYRKLRENPDISYISTDFSDEFLADHHLDIINIALAKHAVDLIICFHILEHIDDDVRAINELSRILKPNGICLIQTPFKEGETYEDPSIVTAKARLKAFGQEDHVRVYSIDGLRNRLLQNGFDKVKVLNIENLTLGIPTQRILLTQKSE